MYSSRHLRIDLPFVGKLFISFDKYYFCPIFPIPLIFLLLLFFSLCFKCEFIYFLLCFKSKMFLSHFFYFNKTSFIFFIFNF